MIKIREMRLEDARTALEIHRDAVRTLGASEYPAEIIDYWSPPVDEARIEKFLSNPEKETRVVAEIDEKIAGFGMVAIAKNELHACYVSPKVGRRGVGSRIVEELENIARKAGLDYLQLESSLNAEAFYRRNGYESLGHAKHIMRNGKEMDCVRMRKKL